MSLGKRLKAEREKRNWSQKFVAERAGITNTVLSNYERDYRDPDTETLKRLADLYEVKTDYLLGRTETNSKPTTISKNDEKDIAKRLEQIKNDLEHSDGLSFNGEPMSEDAIDSLMDAMDFIVRQAKKNNKKYTPKKYRKDDLSE